MSVKLIGCCVYANGEHQGPENPGKSLGAPSVHWKDDPDLAFIPAAQRRCETQADVFLRGNKKIMEIKNAPGILVLCFESCR